MREKIKQLILESVQKLGINFPDELIGKIQVSVPDESKLGDYSTNAALILSKTAKLAPLELAEKITGKMDSGLFEKTEAVKPGFINLFLKPEVIAESLGKLEKTSTKEKILLEYFQPNIAKPLHIGHLETAIIGDTIKRQLLFAGYNVESDTHMGDWGTQFGYLIMAYKKFGKVDEKIYAQLNQQAQDDPSVHETAKQEFLKLEQGDAENRKIWKAIVDESVQQFLKINDLMDILPFDHHWPESFYEDKMPAVLQELQAGGILKQSQGAQIVDLEDQGLGIAIIVKSDGSTTYLLRDLATFLFVRDQGFARHLYVVDNRQSHHYRQLFAILNKLGKINDGEGVHIDYGFISFKGEALSTRKGNMILALDVISQAEEKVGAIIAEKNPDLKNKQQVIKDISKGALKYFILKHNRHSDIEFDWKQALDFDGDSGPYLQYSYARLASITRKESSPGHFSDFSNITSTERQLLFQLSLLNEKVDDSIKDFLPNILANYLYNLAALTNKFYHESPVLKEADESKKQFRLKLIAVAKSVLSRGMDLLGIKTLEEM